jgi:hypothetical protein
MVSFRFHLVSLVAVFLALGLGVLAGTTVINQGLVRRLERDTIESQREVRELEAEVTLWRTFGEEVLPQVAAGRLVGAEVVLVTQEGADETAIADTRTALEDAGADMLGLLTVSDRMALSDDSSRGELAAIVDGLATDEPAELTAAAASEMAAELSFGPGDANVLPGLIREEFVLVGGREAGESVLGSLDGDEAVVVVGGWPDRPAPAPGAFLVPLVEGLVADGSRVAAAEGFQARTRFVSLLRDDSSVNGEIVTQDNVDEDFGQVGLVLAVEDVLAGGTGHYGVKDGVDDMIPPP